MVDRRVPGWSSSSALAVTPAEVAAAKLQVKRAKQRGTQVDPAVAAIADATPAPPPPKDLEAGLRRE